MKKLISLGILSLSLIACGEQFQSYYVGNASISSNTCWPVANSFGQVNLRVRASITGNDADFRIISAASINGPDGDTSAASQVFRKYFVGGLPVISASITGENYIVEKDRIPSVDTDDWRSSGLYSEAQIEEKEEKELLSFRGDISSSRDEITSLQVTRQTTKDASTEQCRVTFTSDRLIRQ